MMYKKELEIEGCKTFICSKMHYIEEYTKMLEENENTKKRLEYAIEQIVNTYVKKTYRNSTHGTTKHIVLGAIYVASHSIEWVDSALPMYTYEDIRRCGAKRNKSGEIESWPAIPTIRKYALEIFNVLGYTNFTKLRKEYK